MRSFPFHNDIAPVNAAGDAGRLQILPATQNTHGALSCCHLDGLLLKAIAESRAILVVFWGVIAPKNSKYGIARS